MGVRNTFTLYYINLYTTIMTFCGSFYRPEDLSVLNSIHEIQGSLRIEGWDEPTFPYLSNLKYIGCNTSTPLKRITSSALANNGCDLPNDPLAVLIQRNLNMIRLDLSSLRQVCEGSVVMFNNPQLCYVGDFGSYFSTSSQVMCFGREYAEETEQCSKQAFLSLLFTLCQTLL